MSFGSPEGQSIGHPPFVREEPNDRRRERDPHYPGGEEARCALATEDIEADHATLRGRGVEVDEVIGRPGTRRPGLVSTDVTVGDPVPPQFFFRDTEGNRFLIVEP